MVDQLVIKKIQKRFSVDAIAKDITLVANSADLDLLVNQSMVKILRKEFD